MAKISESSVRRLSLYLRFLEEFEQRGTPTVSSGELATRGGTTSAQVRKDLSFFGSFGKRGLGYDVPGLAAKLRDILGLKRAYDVVLIGAGKLGGALTQYGGFRERGFNITVVYDRDPGRVGRRWNGLVVRDDSQLERDLTGSPAKIAILAIPETGAQEVTDRLVRCGVQAILNFANIQLSVPDSITVKNVNMALELEVLSYALRNQRLASE